MKAFEHVFHFLLILVIISITLKATLFDSARDIFRKGLKFYVIAVLIVSITGVVVYFLPRCFS